MVTAKEVKETSFLEEDGPEEPTNPVAPQEEETDTEAVSPNFLSRGTTRVASTP